MHPLTGFDNIGWTSDEYWNYASKNCQLLLRHLRTLRRHTANFDLRSPTRLNGLFLVSFPCALLATVLYVKFCWRTKEKVLPGTRAALMSLYAFITPTQSFWPSQYLSIARLAAATNKQVMHLSMATLYRDLLDDAIELRYPREHLPLLFQDKLTVPTCIRLHVELLWWFKLFWFMLTCYMRSGKPSIALITRHEGANDSTAHSPLLPRSPPPPYPRAPREHTDIAAASAPSSTLFFSMLYENAPTVSLDCVPYHALERNIRKLQSTLALGAHLTIGLTTRAGPAAQTFSDPRTILTALPFFPRAYLRGRAAEAGAPGEPRTTTPLFATLPRVLGLLTSGRTPLSIVLVRNVSAEYGVFLRRSAHALEDDWEIRDAFVREWGARAWREERVCTVWEAALVDAGLLAGWAVVVHKPE